VAGASWDHHSCICVTTLDSLIEHDVLRIVLSMDKKENGSDRRYRKTNMVPNKHNSNKRVLAVTLVDNQGLS